MEQDELLRFAVEALNSLGLRFLVTGSIATVIYGEPRFTNDIDLAHAGSRSLLRRTGGLIIKKMEYYREGGSEKHLRDITGILRVSGEQVDRTYIADWAARLDLDEIWSALARRVPP